MTLYELKVDYKNGGHIKVPQVEEFVAGYKYLYVRTSASTLSFDREDIREVYRRSNGVNNQWIPVVMKKSRKAKAVA